MPNFSKIILPSQIEKINKEKLNHNLKQNNKLFVQLLYNQVLSIDEAIKDGKCNYAGSYEASYCHIKLPRQQGNTQALIELSQIFQDRKIAFISLNMHMYKQIINRFSMIPSYSKSTKHIHFFNFAESNLNKLAGNLINSCNLVLIDNGSLFKSEDINQLMFRFYNLCPIISTG